MAEIKPLRALHYDARVAGPIQALVSPPYDVIDGPHRARLLEQSPFNVVEIDLPQGNEPYAHAAETFESWQMQGVLKRDQQPALWALEQRYTGPDGEQRVRRGFFARVRVEEYGAGRIRPHERTHPGPKQDRLNLTRAARANLSPIFSLYSDPDGAAWRAVEPTAGEEPWGQVTDEDGTQHRIWRMADPERIEQAQKAFKDTELLIADGHHRYETARVYAEEVGGEGEHRYVLMCLVALEDPGLTVFPTHRLVKSLSPEQQEALAGTIREHFEVEEVALGELAPPQGSGPLTLGYIDAHFKQPFRLTLRQQQTADEALSDKPAAYRTLDTGVLEALLLKGALRLTDEDVSHLNNFGYARDAAEAIRLVSDGEYDAAFLMRPTPVEQVREVAASGENMPPKSTYFFPKVLTGMLFSPLE